MCDQQVDCTHESVYLPSTDTLSILLSSIPFFSYFKEQFLGGLLLKKTPPCI